MSAASVRRALGVVYLGAKGETAREMAGALGFDPDPAKAAADAKAEAAAWEAATGKAELAIANRVWIDQKVPLVPGFVESAKGAFGAGAEPIDLRGRSEESRKTINAWVAERTKDKIQDLLPKGSVTPSSRMVVTNAIYFKGAWALPFSAGATKDETFHLDGARSVKAPLMHTTDSFRFAEARGAKVLELRYLDTDVSMLVVLPSDPAGLSKLEQALDDELVDGWTKALSQQRVNVTLPRFTFRAGGSIVPWLRDLGVRQAFADQADFGGIAAPPERVAISEVVHQTFIATDEKGTEAAAATAVEMLATALVTGPVTDFRADRPFLFLLRDAKRGRVLFAGRVADPTKQGSE